MVIFGKFIVLFYINFSVDNTDFAIILKSAVFPLFRHHFVVVPSFLLIQFWVNCLQACWTLENVKLSASPVNYGFSGNMPVENMTLVNQLSSTNAVSFVLSCNWKKIGDWLVNVLFMKSKIVFVEVVKILTISEIKENSVSNYIYVFIRKSIKCNV